MAGQKHSRDFFLYSITRTTKENTLHPVNDIFTSSVEDLNNELLFLKTVATFAKQNRSVRAKANNLKNAYIPPTFNNQKKPTFNNQKNKKRKATEVQYKKDLFDKDFLNELDEKSSIDYFPPNIKTIYEKGIFLSNAYKSNKSSKIEEPSVSNNIDTIKVSNQIDKLVLFKDSVGTTENKNKDLKKLAQELLDLAYEIDKKLVAPKKILY